MDIPVYLITGFLDAGKTDFINGILKDGFAAEDRTLLLCCEEGETEYDPKSLFNVFTYTVDDPAQLTPEFFKKLEKQYRPKQVIIEFNGMWSFEPLYREGLPANLSEFGHAAIITDKKCPACFRIIFILPVFRNIALVDTTIIM